MSLTLDIEGGKQVVAPGEQLSGKLDWDLPDEPKRIMLSVLWFTDGKGTRDTETVEEMKILQPGRVGERHFDFELPAGPLSFSGTLITLSWALEAVVYPGKESTRFEFLLSHGGEEIRLSPHAAP